MLLVLLYYVLIVWVIIVEWGFFVVFDGLCWILIVVYVNNVLMDFIVEVLIFDG